MLKIGFIGFGKVSQTIHNHLKNYEDIKLFTTMNNRSFKTIEQIKNSKIDTFKNFKTLSQESDILISAVTPKNALTVAKEVAPYFNGIYLDINTISPITIQKILKYIPKTNYIDCALIGKITDNDSYFIISGENTKKILDLNNYGLKIKKIGNIAGQASQLKMLRSNYTKGVSALLYETFKTAYDLGVDEELLEILQETEGQHFTKKINSRIINSYNYSKRKSEELREINLFLEKNNPKNMIMNNATLELFLKLTKKHEKLDENYNNHQELFQH